MGKKIEFRAPAYEANYPYGGIAIIKSVDFNRHNPIECECLSGDDLRWAFLDNHGLETNDGGKTYHKTNTDICFSYSDNYREVEVRICE